MKPTYNTKMGKESGGHASRRALGGAVLFLLFVLSVPFQPVYAQSSSGSQVYLAGSENSALNRRMITLLRRRWAAPSTFAPSAAARRLRTKPRPLLRSGQKPLLEFGKRIVMCLSWLCLWINRLSVDMRDALKVRFQAYCTTPLIRQAVAGKEILPHATRVAMLARPETVELYESLVDELPAYGLRARVFVVSSDNDLIPTLIHALNYGDFILAAPDSGIYNPRTIKHILLTAYRRNRIVIGPSQAYVKAGSLASTYTPLTEISKLAAKYIEQYRSDGQFPRPPIPMSSELS